MTSTEELESFETWLNTKTTVQTWFKKKKKKLESLFDKRKKRCCFYPKKKKKNERKKKKEKMLKGVEKKLLFDKRKKTQKPLIKKIKEKEHSVYRIVQTQWRRGIFGNFSSTPLLPIFYSENTLIRRDFFWWAHKENASVPPKSLLFSTFIK